MDLSRSLLKAFSEATKPQETKEPIYLYATAKVDGTDVSVRIDGSDVYTPVETTAEIKNGERVLVAIDNHKAMIMGNMSSPAARIQTVEAVSADVGAFKILTTENFVATNAEIGNLKTENANIKNLVAEKASIKDLNATNAEIGNLKAEDANIKKLVAEKASIKDLNATNANIENLGSKYANIDFSNIGNAAMEYFYAQSGLIKNVTIGDATITGELIGVTIKGNLIEGGTVVADKLVIKGADGLYYKLNTDGIKTEAEQTEYNSINGSVILANSIKATKIDVDDLVAFDATIGGFKITEDSIYSGVKESVNNTTRGIYLDNDGQIAFGDANNHIKYFKDTDGNYKLILKADDVILSGKNISFETAIDESVQDALTKAKESGEFKGDDGKDGKMLYATSDTAASTAAKVATITSGTLTLTAGVTVAVKFTYANTSLYPTLNVNGTGAKKVYTNGLHSAYWSANQTAVFTYDGANWQVASSPVYASTVTVGNSAGQNIYIDGDSIDIRTGTTVNARFTEDVIDLGMNSESTVISLHGGTNRIFTLPTAYDGVEMVIQAKDRLFISTGGDVNIQDSFEDREGNIAVNRITTASQRVSLTGSMATLYANAHAQITAQYGSHDGLYTTDGTLLIQREKIRLGLESRNQNVGSLWDNYSYIEILDTGDINIVTEYGGTVNINNNRVMHAKLPSGGYWGMVAPTGSDTVWMRTTSAGILPYAMDNTSKIGSKTWQFSEGHFKSLYANNVFLPNGKAIMGKDTSGGDKNIGYISSEDYLILGGGNYCPVGVTVRGENAVNIRVLNTGLKLENVNNNSTYLGYFHPINDNKVSLGRTAYRWTRLYAANTSISDSDVRLKTDIQPLDKYSELFDKLNPKAFRFKSNPDKVNFGLIAQEVMESMKELGIDIHDLDLVEYDEENDYYGMAYSNIIALLIYEVQKLKEKNNEREIN